ncbi:helix-turn-helix transcriptional regulator [Staphylococcus nepalensis]|uniref:helix-turn-helix domain-containing protein n=1 Tax=Staphylococcus nepalensis TaxID=214473 RepID=UPI001E38A58C|nr:helix-turn-helix transcriptional regulator [Staphylococcus nepalensis]MCD8892452.1 helix-turn-helix transcriptional regulator [Staphylococcus nepalensis]
MIICTLNKLMENTSKTQSEVASKTGITRPTLLSLIRNDNQSIRYETINQLCKFFDVDMSELLVYSPVDVKLKEVLVEKVPYNINYEISKSNLSYSVSLIYEIDGIEFEFDTNLNVIDTDNSLKNSGKLFFSSIVYEDVWKQLTIKNFKKDFIKIYNEAIDFENEIKSKLKEHNLNTDFQITNYDIEIHTMERKDETKEELLNEIESLIKDMPLDKEAKNVFFEQIKKSRKD